MKFDIKETWNHFFSGGIRKQKFLDLLEWLDDNVGWLMSDSIHVLPIMGRGWRIESGIYQDPDSQYKSFGVWLEIDDDTVAVLFKLAFE
jgi:hypothetical protein